MRISDHFWLRCFPLAELEQSTVANATTTVAGGRYACRVPSSSSRPATCVHCYRSLLISTARVVYAVKSDLALVLQNCVFIQWEVHSHLLHTSADFSCISMKRIQSLITATGRPFMRPWQIRVAASPSPPSTPSPPPPRYPRVNSPLNTDDMPWWW